MFCAGHGLGELKQLRHEEMKETFALCAEVMSLIRQSPVPVVGVVQGLATAAGAQLALTTDLPIALAGTQLRLPGASLGLMCTSLRRRCAEAGTGVYVSDACVGGAYEGDQMGGAIDVVAGDMQEALEKRVEEVVSQLAEKMAAQPQALGKWAFWTQVGLSGQEKGRRRV